MQLNEEQMRKLRAVELDIFKEFVSVCQKLGLKYYVLAGTLLGTVRHSGFIPWDDDIDVGMPREDYEVFLKKAQDLLPEPLFLQTYLTDPEYPQVFAKIRNSNTAFIETDLCRQKMNHGIFIDIFPLDVHDSKRKRNLIGKIKILMIASRLSVFHKNADVSKKLLFSRPIARLIYPKIRDALAARNKMHQSARQGDAWANYSSLWGAREIVPSDWYGEGTDLLFEGMPVKAPAQYDRWLTQVYGDYMTLPPVEKRATHHKTVAIDTEKSYREYLG